MATKQQPLSRLGLTSFHTEPPAREAGCAAAHPSRGRRHQAAAELQSGNSKWQHQGKRQGSGSAPRPRVAPVTRQMRGRLGSSAMANCAGSLRC